MIRINIENHHLCISIDFDNLGANCFHEILSHVLKNENEKPIPCTVFIDGKTTESDFCIKYITIDEISKNRELIFDGKEFIAHIDREDLEHIVSLIGEYIDTDTSYPEFIEFVCDHKIYDVYVFLNRKIS